MLTKEGTPGGGQYCAGMGLADDPPRVRAKPPSATAAAAAPRSSLRVVFMWAQLNKGLRETDEIVVNAASSVVLGTGRTCGCRDSPCAASPIRSQAMPSAVLHAARDRKSTRL